MNLSDQWGELHLGEGFDACHTSSLVVPDHVDRFDTSVLLLWHD
jgi:hypothetical protein